MATVTAQQMLELGKLRTLDQLRENLSTIEPLHEHTFASSSGNQFTLSEDWAKAAEGQGSGSFFATGGQGGVRYELTRQSILEFAAYAKLPRGVSPFMPPNILETYLNWCYRGGLGESKEFKLLSHNRDNADPLALAGCRGTITPFSSLALLGAAEAGIQAKYGEGVQILVDSGGSKLHNGLERTNMRLVIPETERTISGTRVSDDRWSVGIDMKNSLIGVSHPGTGVAGYLFRWWCTNGCTDQLASAGGGKLSRRTISTPEDAYEWARQSVDSILGGLETQFDHIQELATIPVGGGSGSGNVRVSQVLADLFAQHSIPQREQRRIMAELAELGGDLTLYDVQAAITFAANDESISPRTADRLLQLGGHVLHAPRDRCGNCHQLLPDGYAPSPN